MRNALFLLLVYLLTAFSALAQGADAFAAAIEAHGGAALGAVQSLTLRGQSNLGGTNQAVTVSATLEGNAGKLRIDYGQPVSRTEVSTPDGGFRTVQGKTVWLAPHAGAYAQLDLLSVFGVLHLANAIEKTPRGAGTVAGRPTARVNAVTGRDQTQYRRRIKDEAEVQFDAETGLVAAISRTQYADESLDLSFVRTTTFSDYRPYGGFVFPFRINRYIDGVLRETFTLDSIEINPVFAPETFGR